MARRDLWTRILAVAGTVAIWLPTAAPLLLTTIFFFDTGELRYDFMMPAELMLLALVGGLLMLWAAFRARAYRAWVGGGLIAAAVGLLGAQGLAVALGLAHGDVEPTGWRVVVVLGLLFVYNIMLVVLGVVGVLLCRRVFGAGAAQAA